MKIRFLAVALLQLVFCAAANAQFILVSSSPAKNAVSVPLNQPITLVFSDKIDAASVSSSVLVNSNFRGLLQVTTTVADSALTIIPSSPFEISEEITVMLFPSLKALTQDPLSNGDVLRFMTKTSPSPQTPALFKSFPLAITGVSSIAAADMDGDGDLDIITRTSGLHWQENMGASKFTDHLIEQPSDAFYKIIPIDIDRDGDMDLLSASGSSGVLQYLNDGAQNFSVSSIGGAGLTTFSIEVIDIDLNGFFDITYTSPSQGLFVLYNQGNSFTQTKISSQFATQSKCEDIDNDGDVDIIQHDDFNLVYFLNNQGTFETHSIINNGPDYMRDMYVVDLNGDQHLDIVMSSIYSMQVLINNGSLAFTSKILIPNIANNGADYLYITVGDYDGDDDLDIVFPEKNYYFIFENDGVANFTKRNILNESNAFFATSNIVSGDFDLDGDLDFVSSWYQQLTLFKNAAWSEVFPFSDATPNGFKPLTYADADWGDYNQDGNLDLLMIGHDINGVATTVLYDNKNGVLSEHPTSIPGYWDGSCDWGDFDRDGDLDILIMGHNSNDNWVTLIYANNNGSFALFPSSVLPATSNGEARWADMDNDGLLDIVIAGVGLFQSKGSGIFTKKISLPEGNNLATGDYDGDGDLDIAVNGLPPIVYRNDGNWTFKTAKGDFFTGGHLNWADLDRDGDLDLVATDNTTLTVTQNRDSLFSESHFNQVFPQYNVSSSLGDYNNDGYPDLIASTSDGQSSFPAALTLLRNDEGLLKNSGIVLPAVNSWVTTWVDFDLDHDLDILVENKVIQNNSDIKNTRPTPPTQMQVDSIYNNSIFVHWNDGGDTESSSLGLSYQIYTGTQSLHQDIVNSNADLSTGIRKIAELGSANGKRTRVENLAGGNYFLGVQSIDGAFEGSTFSSEVTAFVIGIHGNHGACKGFNYTYAAYPPDNYTWQVTGGTIISGQGTDSVTINWPSTGVGYVKVENANNQKNTFVVDIDLKPNPVIAGSTSICEGYQEYSLSDSLSYNTKWNVQGGTFSYTQTQYATITWTSSGQKEIIAQTFAKHGGCSGYDTLAVMVNPPPDKPVIHDTHSSILVDTLFSTPSPSHLYKWYYYGSLVISGAYQGLIVHQEGSFTVEVFSEYNCPSMSDAFEAKLTNLPPPPITAVSSVEKSLNLYPVPANRKIFLDFVDQFEGVVDFSIYSSTGAAVKQASFQKNEPTVNQEIDVSDLPSGIYIITLTTKEKQYSAKFVKF